VLASANRPRYECNCLAALRVESLERTTFLVATSKSARLDVSDPILEEYEEVLSRPELSIRRGIRLQLLQID
jgi:uncharacterized protein